MSFALPQLLWLLLLPVALLVWELTRARKASATDHPKILRAQAGLRSVTLSDNASGSPTAWKRRVLLCAGLAFGVVALARPQWGRLDEPVYEQSRDILIALDLSRSMTTPDVKPSRLERSKLLVQSLLDKLHGERVGLLVFSGTAFLQSPISADYEILREFLPTLGPDYLPEGGTNYKELLDTALDSFGSASAADRYLIILSDGEATDDDWKDRIEALAKKDVKVIGLGVGTAAGGMIPDGTGNFMKDDKGAVVLSKLESGTLRELANATHGVYVDASQWVDISSILTATVNAGKKGRFVEHTTVRLAERYQWALAQCLACLVASFWLEFPVRPKSRTIKLANPALVGVASLLAFLAFAPSLRSQDASQANPAASLSKIVGRLSAQGSCSALDWSEMGRETISWGQHLKSAGEKVPKRPVRDALSGVELGMKSDPKVTDWPKMKSELEALLAEDPPPQDQKQDQKQNQDQKNDPNKPQDKDQQKKDDSTKQQQDKNKSDKPQDSKDDKQQQNPQQQPQDKTQEGAKPDKGRQDGERPFDQMGKNPAPSPTPSAQQPQRSLQKVGGAKKDPSDDSAAKNPELAPEFQKLEQIKNQDSPAELFDLMRKDEPQPPPSNNGKKW